MPEPRERGWSFEAFLAWEAVQPDRYEFVDRQPRLMTGGTQAHTAICVNIVSLLRERLRGTPCRPGGSDLRVPIPGSGQSRYPDALIDCGRFDPAAHDASEPAVVFEVLSKSNDLRDQYGRLSDYDTVASIRHYVVVAQTEAVVVVYDRDAAGRLAPGRMLTDPAAELVLTVIGISLPLAGIYEGLALSPGTGPNQAAAPL
jgi:Uma2 family endonuclease